MYADVLQLVEGTTDNRDVASSILAVRTNINEVILMEKMAKETKVKLEYKDKLSVYNFSEYLYSLRHLYDSKNFKNARIYKG